MKQSLLLSPLKRQASKNQGNDEILSNKSSPGKIQTSQKEIDDFFENFQQQVQVQFLNFEETMQDCDVQVKKCLNQIFETEIIKEKKQFQTLSAKPPSDQKRNKMIHLKPFKNFETQENDGQKVNFSAPAQSVIQNKVKEEIITSDFLDTTNLTNATTAGGTVGGQTRYNGYDTFKNTEGSAVFLPIINNGMNNFANQNSRFRARSINEATTDSLHRQFIQQRNNCNAGDNIFGIRDHKLDRQRILSNEGRCPQNLNYQILNKNKGKNQKINVIKHPYLDFIKEKESEQQQQQQSFVQSLKNAFRVTFNNPHSNQLKELQKTYKNQQDLTFQNNQLIQQNKKDNQQQQSGFFGELNDVENLTEVGQTNTSQTPIIRNCNVKVFRRKDRSLRPSWNEQSFQNNIKLNNNSFSDTLHKTENNNLLPNIIETNQRNIINNVQNCELIKSDLTNINSQQIFQQLQQIQSHRITKEETILLHDHGDIISLSGKKIQTRIDSQQKPGTNPKSETSRCISQEIEIPSENNTINPTSDKPQKKKVIKISKESVFCKIIQDQKEKQYQKKEVEYQQYIPKKYRAELNNKLKSQDFQDTKIQPNQNKNFEIYQDQSLIEQYVTSNQNLQQKVKMFKFNKKISNKTEKAIEMNEQSSYQDENQILYDKENINENILNNLANINSRKVNTSEDFQLNPQKRVFKRNISFYNQNYSLNNVDPKQQSNEESNIQINNNIPQSEDMQQSQQDDQTKQNKITSQSNSYNIDEIRNSIFLKKITHQQDVCSSFLNEQQQPNKKECNSSDDKTKDLNEPITIKPSLRDQRITQNQNIQQNKNLYDIEPSSKKCKNNKNQIKQKQKKVFGTVLNNNLNIGVKNKKNLGMNQFIADMIIQNIDDFKQKITINQQ